MNQGFIIVNLSPDTRYDAVVCLPGKMPPSNFELAPRCGNFRLCFRTGTQVSVITPCHALYKLG